MAHWAQVDENNIVVNVTVGSNDESDEGYQWLVDNVGGRWLKCSYNTIDGVHLLGGTPFRWTYPVPGFLYVEDGDFFIQQKPYESWILDKDNKKWIPPIPKPDSGIWIWDESTVSWKEYNGE